MVTITNKQKCEGIARAIQVQAALVSKLECRFTVLWCWVGGGLDLNTSQDYLDRSRVGDGCEQLVGGWWGLV